MINKTSISDYEDYKNVCLKASLEDVIFDNFKNDLNYKAILEHTSYELGTAYINYIDNTKFNLDKLDLIKKNDLLGGTRLRNYKSPYGAISPSTLRYTKVLAELEEMFGSLDNKNIIEIGGGYGGQCLLINEYFKPASYTLVDLPEALALSKRYLRDFNHDNILYKTQEELVDNEKYDLLISNYSFSECDRSVQLDYIKKLLNNSSNGYITFNNISNIFNIDSLSRSEFIKAFPCSEKPEIPLSGDNNIYYW
jgi:hypothetical protein